MVTCTIIHANEIDVQKWDACVANNSNGLIYACSNYLNAMAGKWYGLIVNDYELILPLPVKKKMGISYSYMPAFTQQLGFIGQIDLLNAQVVFTLQQFIKYASPYLNFSNSKFAEEYNCDKLNNYIINLNEPYLGIKANYKKTILYSLNKASKLGLNYITDNNFETALQLYKAYNQQNMAHVSATDYTNLKKLFITLQNNQQLLVRKVVDANNNLLSVAVLLKDKKRFYNIINVTPNIGRATESNYFLYDNILKELANQNRLFDFEGSDLPGVQKFYEKFGAINQPYFHWHYNLLPKAIKWLKK